MAIKIAIIEPIIFTGNPPGVDPSHDLRASDNPNIPAVYRLEPGTPTGSRLIATWYTPIDTIINIKGFAKINPQLVADANDPTDIDVQLGLAADISEVNNITMRVRIYVLYDDTVPPPPAPRLLVQPTTLNFTTVQGINPAPQTFTITNTGSAPLNWVITEDANAAMYAPVTPTRSTLAPGQSITITVTPNIARASVGTINALITVADSDPGTTVQSQQVAVSLNILAPPTLTVTPTTLSFTQITGSSTQSITVGNSGGELLNWMSALASNAPTYVTISSATSGTLAAGAITTVQITVDTTGVLGGTTVSTSLTISATDPVTGSAALGSPSTVNISITTSPPAMLLSTNELNFTTTLGINPPPQEIILLNSGGNGLNWTVGVPSQAWLLVTPTAGSEASGDSSVLSFQVDITGLEFVTSPAIVTITPSTGTMQVVTVNLTVN